MQSFQGSSFIGNQASAAEQAASIVQMVVDGTQGTMTGSGLVQGVNQWGDIYDVSPYVLVLTFIMLFLALPLRYHEKERASDN